MEKAKRNFMMRVPETWTVFLKQNSHTVNFHFIRVRVGLDQNILCSDMGVLITQQQRDRLVILHACGQNSPNTPQTLRYIWSLRYSL